MLAQVYPISLSALLDVPINCVGAVSLYMYAFGYVKQHPVNRYGNILELLLKKNLSNKMHLKSVNVITLKLISNEGNVNEN